MTHWHGAPFHFQRSFGDQSPPVTGLFLVTVAIPYGMFSSRKSPTL
jgi:hypothetical protein